MYKLDNVIKNYAWGSHTALANLRGDPPSQAPEAELWLGAHPQGSSRIRGGPSLQDAIAQAPLDYLGKRVYEGFGGLPFLMKALAAGSPLSLQVHPSMAQAQLGFSREDAANIPRDASHRSYRDKRHKPELILALSEFEALSGFRSPAQVRELVAELDVVALSELLAVAEQRQTDKRPALALLLAALLRAPRGEAVRLTEAVVGRAHALQGAAGSFCQSYAWAVRLAAAYPGDPGVVASLLLQHVVLAPGEAMFLDAGNLHAYLSGVGIEIMAASDNVLRGGLTPKHIDVLELLSIIDFAALPPQRIEPEIRGQARIYRTKAAEFLLEVWDLSLGDASFEPDGPEIVLQLSGEATFARGSGSLHLARAEAAFWGPGDGPIRATGSGMLYRARVPS